MKENKMTSLGKKLSAMKVLTAAMDNITDVCSAEEAETLNAQFALFDKRFVVEKDEQGRYDLVQAKEFFTLCTDIVKKEYSAKLFESIAIQRMFEE